MMPRLPAMQVVTDRTVTQNLQTHIPPQEFLDFDANARRRGLAKSVLLRRMIEAVNRKPQLLDVILGKRFKP